MLFKKKTLAGFQTEYSNTDLTNINELKNEEPAKKFVPYLAQIDDSTISLKNGEILKIVKLEGIYLNASNPRKLNDSNNRLKMAMLAISDPRIMIWHTAIKSKVSNRVTGTFTNEYAQEFAKDYQQNLDNKEHYKLEHYFTFMIKGANSQVLGFLESLSNIIHRGVGASNTLSKVRKDLLNATVEKFISLMTPYQPHVLTTVIEDGKAISEPLSLLYKIVNGHEKRIPVNDKVINTWITTTRPFFYKSYGIQTHHSHSPRYFACISKKEFIAKATASIDINSIMNLRSEFIFTHTFEFIAKSEAVTEIEKKQRGLSSSGDKGFTEIDELYLAMDEVSTRKGIFGDSTLDLIVFTENKDNLSAIVREADSAFSNANFIGVREDIILEAKYWNMLPGQFQYRTRVTQISSNNFSDWSSMHVENAYWPKKTRWGECLITAQTKQDAPFGLDFHVGEVGHTTIIANTGSGKTVLLTTIAVMLNKVNGILVYFDKLRNAQTAIEAVNGNYFIITPGHKTKFNPCALPDKIENRTFLRQLLQILVTNTGDELTAEQVSIVHRVAEANYSLPQSLRRLSNLKGMFPSGDNDTLLNRFKLWIEDGPNAWLFDNESDELTLNKTTGFDLTSILDNKEVREPALAFIAHITNNRVDGSPFAVVIDEGWKGLDDEIFAQKILDWELTGRTRNMAVFFTCQDPISLEVTDQASSWRNTAASSIVSQSTTKIFGYNNDPKKRIYQSVFSVSDWEFNLIENLKPREWLIINDNVCEIFKLNYEGMPDHLILLSPGVERLQTYDKLFANKPFDRKLFLEALKK